VLKVVSDRQHIVNKGTAIIQVM